MTWDPFGDLHDRGILRNVFRLHDPRKLARQEYLSLRMNMPRALDVLSREKVIDLRSWRRTHAVLFGDVYPWAGKLRELDVERGPVRFNTCKLIEKEADAVFTEARRDGFLAENLGYVYGELAFNHPFLDGNGRSLNTVFSEMCHRAGFDLAWDQVDKKAYLHHLTHAVALKEYDGLHDYLSALVVPKETFERRAERLTIPA